jgi:hypothetical protein
MQIDTVYIIEEENHGIIGVADSKEAVFSFLVNHGWITEELPCGYSWDDDRTLTDICIEEDITEENFLDWAVFKLENTDFWENAGFFIRGETLYTEKTINLIKKQA